MTSYLKLVKLRLELKNLPMNILKRFKSREGFTLIELLVVIAIITALGVAVFAALNPGQRVKDANDARRTEDVDAILTSIHQSIVDNKGTTPSNLPAAGTEAQLGTAGSGCAIVTGGCNVAQTTCVDLMTGTQNLAKYLKTMPTDPVSGTPGTTKYSVLVDTNNIVTIRACARQGTIDISASR